MISLSTAEPRPDGVGNFIFNESPGSKIKNNVARVVSVPTLDGGSVIIHSGVSITDSVVQIKGILTKTQEDDLWNIFNNESFVLLASGNDLFFVSIKSLTTDDGKLVMSIIINSKEN